MPYRHCQPNHHYYKQATQRNILLWFQKNSLIFPTYSALLHFHTLLTRYHFLFLVLSLQKTSHIMSSSSVFTNYPLISAFLAFSVAQSIKFFTYWYKEKQWDFRQLVASGGMPSSHSATVAALATATGFQEGFGGAIFAAALILTCIVMYDATGVRLQAGRQAEVLNQIVCELPAEHPLAESRPLRELLGHTPPQVIAGGLLGVITAAVCHLITLAAAR